jgi:hypothetical protein
MANQSQTSERAVCLCQQKQERQKPGQHRGLGGGYSLRAQLTERGAPRRNAVCGEPTPLRRSHAALELSAETQSGWEETQTPAQPEHYRSTLSGHSRQAARDCSHRFLEATLEVNVTR